MPPIEFGGHLVEILFDIGPATSTGFGPAPISEAELAAWQFNRGIRLRPWECETIRRLSREYVRMMHLAEKQGMPPPYTPETVMSGEARKAVGEGLKSLAQKHNSMKVRK